MGAERLVQVRLKVALDMGNVNETLWLEEAFAAGLVAERLAALTGEVREADDGSGKGEGEGGAPGGDGARLQGKPQAGRQDR